MKTAFLDKVIERIDRIDPKNLQAHFLRLAGEKGLMEAVFQAIHEGIVVLDAEGRVTYMNRATETLLGIPPDSALGKPISRYLRDIDWKRILDFDAGEWSKIVSYEVEVSYPEPRALNFYVVPLSPRGVVDPHITPGGESEGGVLVMLRDITRDRRIGASAMESERMNAVKLLAAGVAHEIGNPLNALNIHLQLIDREAQRLRPEDRDSIHELLKVARDEVSRLDAIITQFLRAIRPSHPNLVLAQIEKILEETLNLLKLDIEGRKIRVEIGGPVALPAIPVDPQQIKQAFFNVIKNSFQAMQDGGSLSIELTCSDRFMEISFRDTGVGISKQDLGRIFEPYHTTKQEGTGLGLMIVQRIVQDHGGMIEVCSEPNAGTTVTILLPLIERRIRLLKSKSAEA